MCSPRAPACIEIALVAANSAAERAGLRVGDLVLSVDGRPISAAREFMMVLRPAAERTVTLEVRRGADPPDSPAPGSRNSRRFLGGPLPGFQIHPGDSGFKNL